MTILNLYKRARRRSVEQQERIAWLLRQVETRQQTVERLSAQLVAVSTHRDELLRVAGQVEVAEAFLEDALGYIGCASLAAHPAHSSHRWVADVTAFLHHIEAR